MSKSPESVRSPESGVRSSEGRAKQESRVTSYKSQSLWTPDSGLRTPESVYPKHSKIFENTTCFVSFVSFGSFRSPESLSGGAFFQGRSEGHFPEGGAFSGGGFWGSLGGHFPESGELFRSGPVSGVRRTRLSGTPFSGAGLRIFSLSGPFSGVRRPHNLSLELENSQLSMAAVSCIEKMDVICVNW